MNKICDYREYGEKESMECARLEKSEQEKLNITSNYFVASDLRMDYAFPRLARKKLARENKYKNRKEKQNER